MVAQVVEMDAGPCINSWARKKVGKRLVMDVRRRINLADSHFSFRATGASWAMNNLWAVSV